MREPLEEIRCDRCAKRDLIGTPQNDDGRRGDWAQIRAEQLTGKTVIANASDEEKPADLCRDCTAELVQWFMQPRLDKLKANPSA